MRCDSERSASARVKHTLTPPHLPAACHPQAGADGVATLKGPAFRGFLLTPVGGAVLSVADASVSQEICGGGIGHNSPFSKTAVPFRVAGSGGVKAQVLITPHVWHTITVQL